ncbi:MAG: hypothetical protein ACRDNC_09390 [Gaiellaceae bacterium]
MSKRAGRATFGLLFAGVTVQTRQSSNVPACVAILQQVAVTRWGTSREPFSTTHCTAVALRYVALRPVIDEGRALGMTQDLAYDMMLEVQGLIRSVAVRTRLDRELRIGETFSMRGRRWVVSEVKPLAGKASTDG